MIYTNKQTAAIVCINNCGSNFLCMCNVRNLKIQNFWILCILFWILNLLLTSCTGNDCRYCLTRYVSKFSSWNQANGQKQNWNRMRNRTNYCIFCVYVHVYINNMSGASNILPYAQIFGFLDFTFWNIHKFSSWNQAISQKRNRNRMRNRKQSEPTFVFFCVCWLKICAEIFGSQILEYFFEFLFFGKPVN